MRCPYRGCSWEPIAPSERVAESKLAEHVVFEHGEVVDEQIPEGLVKISLDGGETWITTRPERAKQVQRLYYD